MRLSSLQKSNTSIGITVELVQGDEKDYRYRLRCGECRFTLTIYLPPGLNGHWAAGIRYVLKKVENGALWPVIFDYPNMTQFISMKDLQDMEKSLRLVPFAVFNIPKKLLNDPAKDAEYIRIRNKIAREKYHHAKLASNTN